MKVGHSNRILGLKSFLRSSALEQFGKCLSEERYESARDASGSDHALFEAATETRRKQCKKRGERFTAKSESTTSDAGNALRPVLSLSANKNRVVAAWSCLLRCSFLA